MTARVSVQRGVPFEIAQITDTPVILIVNCRGISNSVGAVLKGFTTFQENSQIRGVIFNQMSEKLYPQAKKAAQELGLIPLGFLPYKRVEHWKAVIWGWLQQMKSCILKKNRHDSRADEKNVLI